MAFATSVKVAVYRHFADRGRAPRHEDIARTLAVSLADVKDAYRQLQASRVLLLEATASAFAWRRHFPALKPSIALGSAQ